MTSFRYRFHEWLADHFGRVQYPRQEYLPHGGMPKRRLFQFKYQMPWWERLALVQIGLLMLVVSFGLLAVGLVFAYALVRAIFTH